VPSDSDPIDKLFDVPLADFTATRNRVARELKQEGRADLAAEVTALRKPTVPIWLVNQLARRHRRDVDLLLDAGHRLRAAHGESDPARARQAFQGARDAEREAMHRLRKAAEELLRQEQGKASDAMIERAVGTLRAASVTEEGRELLARGRLTEELETTGFELAATLVPPSRPATGKRAAKKDAVGAARVELQSAKEAEREALRRLRRAERRAAELRGELVEAESELKQARGEADDAGEAVAAAESALKRARGQS
jgi:hypothetical protein